MNSSILIVGGYGQVGRIVAGWLVQRYPGQVIVAGRRLEPARDLANELGAGTRALQVDVNDPPPQALEGVGTVITSIERSNDAIVRACLDAGSHYTEVATSYDTLEAVLRLREHTTGSRSAVIAGVGLMPGLSGMLAAHLAQAVDVVEQVETHIMLGLGDDHGIDAIRWMQHYLDRTFTVDTPDGPQRVESLTGPTQVLFPRERRPHTSYRFDFADQHALPESIGARGASTYLCFDSRLATRLLGLLKTLGLHRLPARLHPATFARLARRWPGGTDRYALVVRLTGNASQPAHRAAATGHGQSHVTGIVTALAAARLHDGHVPPGIHHLEQVVTLDHLRDGLEHEGIELWTESTPIRT